VPFLWWIASWCSCCVVSKRKHSEIIVADFYRAFPQNRNFLYFFLSRNAMTMQCKEGTDALRIKRRKNRLCGFGSTREQNSGSQKTKTKNTWQWYFTHMPRRSQWGNHLNFSTWGDTNFVLIGSGVFVVLTPPISPFSVGLAVCPEENFNHWAHWPYLFVIHYLAPERKKSPEHLLLRFEIEQQTERN